MSRRRSSRYGALHMVGRQLGADRATSVLVAVTVLVVAAVLAAAPRSISSLFGADLRDQVGELGAGQRDPSASGTWFPALDLAGGFDPAITLDGEETRLASLRAEHAGSALKAVLGAGEYTLTRPRASLDKGADAPDIAWMNVLVRVDPRIGDRVRVVEGELPGPVDPALVAAVTTTGVSATASDVLPLPVMTSVDSAEWLRWRVGEVRDVGGLAPAVLTGVFEAEDPGAGYWSHQVSTLRPVVDEDGNIGTTVTAVVYADPSALAILVYPSGMSRQTWYPVDVDAVATVDRAGLAAELRRFLAGTGTSSELAGTLDAAVERQAMLNALLSVLTVGPAGAALGVLRLAGLLGLERRRTALATVRARGATPAQLRLVLAGQGWAMGVPAAVAGALIATAAIPAPGRATDYLLPGLVAVAPGGLMALAVGRIGARPERADLGRRARRPLRWLVELAVIALAALSVLAVRQRGLAGGEGGLDPILLACPVLLALAASVVVLRLYPLPMRRLAGRLHGRRPLAHFLGAATAGRAPAGGTGPVVALVLGVAVTVLSVVALSTVRVGAVQTAAQMAGADLRIDGRGFTREQVDAVRTADGVAEVAVVGDAGPVVVVADRVSHPVDAVVVDVAALAAVQRGLPGVDTVPDGLGDPGPGGPAVMMGSADDVGRGVTLLLGGSDEPVPGHVVAQRAAVPGVTSGRDWLVVDRAVFVTATGREPQVDRLLVRLVPGATAGDVVAALEPVLGAVDVTTPGGAMAALRENVLVRSTQTGLAVLTGLSALLCAVIVGLALAVGAPARGRLSALLSTVGAPAGTRRRLVLWEVGPLAVVGGTAGTLVGAALPRLLLGATDLRPFTGGAVQPAMTVEPVVVAVLVAGVLVATSAAVALATVRAGRTRAVTVLREGAPS